MNVKHFLALDYGTQSVRAIIFDKAGKALYQSQIKVEPFVDGEKGSAEQNPEYCYQKLVESVRRLLTVNNIDPSLISSVALTTQRASSVLLDSEHKAISPIYMWSDTRLADETKLSMMSWYFRLAFKVVGMSSRITFLRKAAKVNYLKEHKPELIDSADKVALFSGYLTHKISAKLIDSIASQVAYLPFDYQRLGWAKSLSWRWQALACNRKQMVDLVPATHFIGNICADFAKDTGLDPTTKVYTAGGDKNCEMFAGGSGERGIANVSLGSAASISIGLDNYQETFRYMPSFPSLLENQYINEVQLERGFWLLTWLIDEFGKEDKDKARLLGKSVEAYICTEIETIPAGSEGLMLSPTWSQGVIFPGPEAKGCIVGFTPKHTRFHLYRAAIEGVLFTLKAALIRLEKKHNFPIAVVRITGGGSKSEQVLQMAANIFNRPVETIDVGEASALGAAMCCAVGEKVYPDLVSARNNMVKIKERIQPEQSVSDQYQSLYSAHSKIYGKLKPIFKELVTRGF
ncbi:carbohydrate kinase [Shewanella sp. OPT22]|nr:carbohydrate kinase [Shewanella sp. OPT22]